jgi:hypothetical protein
MQAVSCALSIVSKFSGIGAIVIFKWSMQVRWLGVTK